MLSGVLVADLRGAHLGAGFGRLPRCAETTIAAGWLGFGRNDPVHPSCLCHDGNTQHAEADIRALTSAFQGRVTEQTGLGKMMGAAHDRCVRATLAFAI